jgi:hypothetical protein
MQNSVGEPLQVPWGLHVDSKIDVLDAFFADLL